MVMNAKYNSTQKTKVEGWGRQFDAILSVILSLPSYMLAVLHSYSIICVCVYIWYKFRYSIFPKVK